MIKSVIFDWGGVLIDEPTPKRTAYCAKRLGISESRFLKTQRMFEGAFQEGCSEEIFWEQMCKKLNVSLPKSSSLWGDAFRAVYSEKPKMFSLASSLQDRGYTTALLSNVEAPGVAYFCEKGYSMFDVTVFSCVEGVRKPEKYIYKIALDRLCIAPEEAVFIDDRNDYVAGAECLGIYGILFQSEEQTKEELNYLLTT